jgi:hypothetical protein
VTVVNGHGEENETVDNAVLMEIESLRRATLAALREKYQEVFREETRSRHREHLFRRIAWRLQALAEGDLSERARGRAHQIAQDADLRKIAPRDFFTAGGERIEITRANRNRREQDSRLPLPGAALSRKWKGRTILVEVLARGFRYPYYLCLNAQRRGWAVCPAKSLPARGIEESVLGQIREAQRGIPDPAVWEQMDRTRQVEAMQAIVQRVGYDGSARQISIRFHQTAITTGQEARA